MSRMEGEGNAKVGGTGEEMAAAKEKGSSFAATCNLLSRYLREKKAGLAVSGIVDMPPPPAADVGGGAFRPPATMNLLSGLEETSAAKTSAVDVELSLEKACTGQLLGAFPTENQDAENTRELAAKEEARQLTIFYGGKVVVVDNFPSAKVKELLQIANAGDGALDKAGSGSAVPQSLPQPAQSSLPDLPIARRNSLHRFLEKRKGRVIAKAPYQVHSSVAPFKQARFRPRSANEAAGDVMMNSPLGAIDMWE